jgi:hypothetical protein
MFNKNDVLPGLLLGILLPLAGFAILYQLFNLLELWGAASGTGLSSNFRERTLAILAIALNLIPLNIYRNRRWESAMRGVVIATGILSLAWVFRFGIQLL